MRYVVELLPQDDGGAVIVAPSGFIRLSAIEMSQLLSLLGRHYEGRLVELPIDVQADDKGRTER